MVPLLCSNAHPSASASRLLKTQHRLSIFSPVQLRHLLVSPFNADVCLCQPAFLYTARASLRVCFFSAALVLRPFDSSHRAGCSSCDFYVTFFRCPPPFTASNTCWRALKLSESLTCLLVATAATYRTLSPFPRSTRACSGRGRIWYSTPLS